MGDLGHWDNHGNYRYQLRFVAKKMKFGRDRPNVPTIELECGRGTPWFDHDSLGVVPLFDDGVNPVGVCYEVLTCDVTGAGLADSDLYQDGWNATRVAMGATGFRIGVRQTEQTDIRGFLATILEYFDGFLIRRGTQIALGYWTTGDINTSTLPILGSDDLYGEPRLTPTGWDDLLTSVTVSYKDREQYYHDIPAKVDNPSLRQALDEDRPAFLQRPFIIDADHANDYATEYLQRFARPGISGDADFKLDSIEAIEDATGMPIQGQRVKIDVASLGEELVFRVTDCEYPGDEGPFFCTLTLELERSIWPVKFVQPPPDPIGNFEVKVPNIVHKQLVELPSGLKIGTGIQVGILAQRPARTVKGFHVCTSLDGVEYVTHNPPSTFAAHGITHASTGTGTSFVVEFFGVDLPQQIARSSDFEVLAFCGSELMSFANWVSLGSGLYTVTVVRGRYSTTNVSHVVDTDIFFIRRDHLIRITDKNFRIGNTVQFKLQPFDDRQDFDLADVTAFPHTFGGGAVSTPSAPTLTAISGVTDDGKINAAIVATWPALPEEQDISFYNVSIKRSTETNWTTTNNGAELIARWELLVPGAVYQVRVQGVNSQGETGAWSPVSTKTAVNHATLAAPTFTNDYDTTSLTSRTYDDLTQLSIRAHTGLSGRKIRFELNKRVQPDSPFWAWYPPNHGGSTVGDGTGTDDFAGYIQSDGILGSGVGTHITNTWHACIVDPAFDSVLGPEAVITLTWVPGSGYQCPEPFFAYVVHAGSGTKLGDADYRFKVVDQLGGCRIFFNFNDGAWTEYSHTGNYKSPSSGSVLPTGNVGAISMAQSDKCSVYMTKPGYSQSKIRTLFNNDTNTPDDGGGGGSGGTGGDVDANTKFLP